MQIIDQKEFVIAALNPGKEAFVIYMAYLEAKILIHLVWEAQIALLLIGKVTIPAEVFGLCQQLLKKP